MHITPPITAHILYVHGSDLSVTVCNDPLGITTRNQISLLSYCFNWYSELDTLIQLHAWTNVWLLIHSSHLYWSATLHTFLCALTIFTHYSQYMTAVLANMAAILANMAAILANMVAILANMAAILANMAASFHSVQVNRNICWRRCGLLLAACCPCKLLHCLLVLKQIMWLSTCSKYFSLL